MAINDNTTVQLREILEQICTTANAFNDLLIELSDLRGSYALRPIAQNIGYLADLGLSKITGGFECVGDAEDWMLPPAYHSAKEAAEVGHAK